MGWNLNDLTSSAGATAAASNPTGYVVPARSTQHVFYRGADNHIVELTWDRRGWHRLDLHASAGRPLAAGDPLGLTFLRGGTQHVVYAGVDGHVHDLANPGEGFQHQDLSAASHCGVAIAGSPTACVLEKHGSLHVYFRDGAGKVYEITSDAAGSRNADVSAAATGALPAAGVLSAVADQATGARYVVYADASGHVWELSCDASGWRATNLSAVVKGAPSAAGAPAAYLFDGQGTRHVVYRCPQGRIHELWCGADGWHHEDLTQQTGAPDATDDPTGYMFHLQGTQHVLYRASDSLLHELWWDVNGWHHDAPGGIGPAATGRAAGYSFEMQKTQHAVYRQADGRVAELWWQPDGTGTGGAGKSADANAIAMKWDPIVFDGGIPVGGSAALTLHTDGRWEFSGHFHGSGFSPYDINIVWAVRTSTGALFTFSTDGSVAGTLGAGSRDFQWNLGGTDADLKAAWSDLLAGWSWQAQSGTSLELGRLWGDVKGALGEVHAITAVVGPLFS